MRRAPKYIAAVAVLVIAVAGIRESVSRPGSDSSDGQPDSSAAASVPDRADMSTGPIGRGRDAGGSRLEARDAAEAAVHATGDIAAAGFITRADLIRELTTARFAPTLIEESSDQLDAMTSELTPAGVSVGSVRFAELPLTAHIVGFAPATATVEVWSVTVITVGDELAPRQVWRTVTVTLAWQNDTWLVDGWAAVPGPTPALATSSEIASVADIESVVNWPAVGGG